MSPLKIFFVIDRYYSPHGGTESQLQMLIEGLVAHGHQVRLFVLRHTDFTRGNPAFPCEISSLEVQSAMSRAAIMSAARFRQRVIREKPDAVHVFFNDAAVIVPLALAFTGTPVFTSRRDMGFWYTRRTLLALRMANRFARAIICNCNAVADHVSRQERVRVSRLRVIYNGLRPNGPTGPGNRRFSTEGAVRVCLVANIRPIKRIEDFLRAAAAVRAAVPASEFFIVGEPSEQEYARTLEQLVHDLDLDQHVRFTGPMQNPASMLASCDIGVLTSESEGFSNSLLEYMSCGLAVVCSDAGGNREMVEHGRNGYLYPVGDVDALAHHLLELCSQRAMRIAMAAESLHRVRRFSSDAMVNAHIDLYRQPLERGGRREVAA